MGIRTSFNAPLGMPAFGVAFDDNQGIAPGTRCQGYDDENDIVNNYIWLQSAASIAVGDDVDFDAAYDTTEVTADTGMADAIVASADGQYAWFQLKPEPAVA